MRGGKNGFAALVHQRTTGTVKRRKLDDYETPSDVTERLLRFFPLPSDETILEPAAGSGFMVRALRADGHKVIGLDIKHGSDFLARTKKWKGPLVTNPPYRDGLAERFVRHALKLADGPVCMLMQSGFVWGDKRASGLFDECPPAVVIVIPERIYFLVNGKPIKSQFFSHAWLCWPRRELRSVRENYDCKTYWASKDALDT